MTYDSEAMPSRLIHELADAARSLATLEEVVAWMHGLESPGEIAEVLEQDEFSIDVVISFGPLSHLVFDTT